MRLLIVDDSNLIRTRIARVAQDGRLPRITIVGLARNGVEAVEIARSTNPDVITMDLTMPELDGVEAISRIVRAIPSVSILVVSALTDKATAIRALSLGARGFLAKPFEDDQLALALLEVAQPSVKG
jgi:two-component system chemotaxis response regulator CheY